MLCAWDRPVASSFLLVLNRIAHCHPVLGRMPGAGAPSLPALKALQDWAPNHLVRVYEQPCNMGASLTRNTGMAQSFGDWTVLLDDDVIPDEAILDAYLGAVLRYPKAKILVGHTRLPEPQTRMQHALVSENKAMSMHLTECA